MQNHHYRKVCRICFHVITECRCPSKDKEIIWDICDDCDRLAVVEIDMENDLYFADVWVDDDDE